MSPTALFDWPDTTRGCTDVVYTAGMVGEGVPGVWGLGGPGGVLYRVLPRTLQDPIFSIFKAKGPPYGQMKAISVISMRFLR